MKFLISNSVPLNGGDEALLRALVLSLRETWPKSQITVLCKDLERCRRQLPDLNMAADLEFAENKRDRDQTLAHYRDCDIVLSAPGGFLHDYYPIEKRLAGFELALGLNKPVVLLGQSVGPFWKEKSIKRVRDVLNRVSRICIRDDISKQHLEKCGVDLSQTVVTGDVAFLWRRIAPELYKPRANDGEQLIGLSFRVWPLGDRDSQQDTVQKAKQLCEHLLLDPRRRVRFISTCQGIPGYVDDSQLATKIRSLLSSELQQRCEVDSSRYPPREMIAALGMCDAFIGMRLHACILAMLAGVPALGLGYEDKTEQIFAQLGLSSYQVRFDLSADAWIGTTQTFFRDLNTIRAALPNALDRQAAAAGKNIEEVERVLSLITENRPITTEERWSSSVKRYGRPHLRLRQTAFLANELGPKRMLDLGCATGHLRFLCPGVEYVGCDFINPSAPIDFSFYQCNFNRDPIPVELAGFDVVVCSGILEYIENLPAFLTRLRFGVRPGSHLILTYFNMNHVSRIGKMILGKSFQAHPDWKGFYSPNDFKKMLQSNGLQITRSIPMNHALGRAGSVEELTSSPLRFPKNYPWSTLLAHQFLFVVKPTGSA